MNLFRNFLIPERKIDISNRVNSRGVTLVLVLSFILVFLALANVAIIFMRSQTKFSHQQLSRIQATYAAQGGMNYALDQLRTVTWVAGTNCTQASPCLVSFDSGDFKPASIVNNQVSVVIWAAGDVAAPANCLVDFACIQVTAEYTP